MISSKKKGNGKSSYGGSSSSGFGSASSCGSSGFKNSKSSCSKYDPTLNSNSSSSYKRSTSTPSYSSSSSSSKKDNYSSKCSYNTPSYSRSISVSDAKKSSCNSFSKPRDERTQSYNSGAGGGLPTGNKKSTDSKNYSQGNSYCTNSSFSSNNSKNDKKGSSFVNDKSGLSFGKDKSYSSKPTSSSSASGLFSMGTSSSSNVKQSTSSLSMGNKSSKFSLDKTVPKSSDNYGNNTQTLGLFEKSKTKKSNDNFSVDHLPKYSAQLSNDNQSVLKKEKNKVTQNSSSLFGGFGTNASNKIKDSAKENHFGPMNSFDNNKNPSKTNFSKGSGMTHNTSSQPNILHKNIMNTNPVASSHLSNKSTVSAMNIPMIGGATQLNKELNKQFETKQKLSSQKILNTNFDSNKLVSSSDFNRNLKNLESFKTKPSNSHLPLTLFPIGDSNENHSHKHIIEPIGKIKSSNSNNKNVISMGSSSTGQNQHTFDDRRTCDKGYKNSVPQQGNSINSKSNKSQFSNQDVALSDIAKIIANSTDLKLRERKDVQTNIVDKSVLKTSPNKLKCNSTDHQLSGIGSSNSHSMVSSERGVQKKPKQSSVTERSIQDHANGASQSMNTTRCLPAQAVNHPMPVQRMESIQCAPPHNITNLQEARSPPAKTKSTSKGLGFLSFNNLSQVMGLGPLKKPPKKIKTGRTADLSIPTVSPTNVLGVQSSSSNPNFQTSLRNHSSTCNSTTETPVSQRHEPHSNSVSNSASLAEHSRNMILSSLMFPNVGHQNGPHNLIATSPPSPFVLFNGVNSRRRIFDRDRQERMSQNSRCRNERNIFEENEFTPLGLSAQGPHSGMVSRNNPSISHEGNNNSHTSNNTMSTVPDEESLISSNLIRTTPTSEEIAARKLTIKLENVDDFKNTYDRAVQAIRIGKELTFDGNFSQACAEFEVGLKLMDYILELKIDQFEMSSIHKTICTSIQEVILLDRKSALEGFSDAQAGILSPHRYESSAPSALEEVPTAPPSYDDVLREDLEKTFFAGGCDAQTQGALVFPSPSDALLISPSAPPDLTRMGTPPPGYTNNQGSPANKTDSVSIVTVPTHTGTSISQNVKIEANVSQVSKTENSSEAMKQFQENKSKSIVNESARGATNHANITSNLHIEGSQQQPCGSKVTAISNCTYVKNIGRVTEPVPHKPVNVEEELTAKIVTDKSSTIQAQEPKTDFNNKISIKEVPKKSTSPSFHQESFPSSNKEMSTSVNDPIYANCESVIDSKTKRVTDSSTFIPEVKPSNADESTINRNKSDSIMRDSNEGERVSPEAQSISKNNCDSKQNIDAVDISSVSDRCKVPLHIPDVKIFFFNQNQTIMSPNVKQKMAITQEKVNGNGRPCRTKLEIGHQLWTLNLDFETATVLKTIDEDYIFKDLDGNFIGLKLATKVKLQLKENFNAILKTNAIYQRESRRNSESSTDSSVLTEASPKEKSPSLHFQARDFSRRSFKAVQSATNAIAKSFTNITGGSTSNCSANDILKMEGDMEELQIRGRQLQTARHNKAIIYF